MWNGRLRRIYHYVATLEYPYTVGCFHGAKASIGRTGAPGAGGSHPAGPGPGAV